MLNKIDNQSILMIILTSAIIPLIIYYEYKNKKQLALNQSNREYYIQWYIITLIISLFTISTLKEKLSITDDIFQGIMPNYL